MKWSELVMINLQRTADGRWSFTAYGPDYKVWRSNRGLQDVFACVEQIHGETEEGISAEAEADFYTRHEVEANSAADLVPPAGERTQSADGSKRRRKQSGVFVAGPANFKDVDSVKARKRKQ